MLLRCPECSQKVSSSASRCPACGYSISSGVQVVNGLGNVASSSLAVVWWIFVIVLLCSLVVSCFSS
ncbi:zinc ribbon domain-containing protein [Sphingomonas sp.]|uniref:zinc ribbon domain-containing protein n=1 Tax=Sphingomonas sp. TaxID=28214 RepID=UPI0039C8DBFE